MKKNAKRLLTLFVASSLFLGDSLIPVCAESNSEAQTDTINDSIMDETIQPKDVNWYDGLLWEYSSRSLSGSTTGAKKYVTEHTAGSNGKGETLNVTTSLSLSASFSGSINSASAQKVAKEFGFTLGVEVGLAATRNSRPLNNYEKVTAYAVPVYDTYLVTEREISYSLRNGKYTKYEPTGRTRTGTVKIPKTIDILFEYSK
mgnify:CR=1 FL=1